MKSQLLSALFLFQFGCLPFINAQDLITIQPGARGGSMGGIKSIHTDILAMYGNEAGLGFLEQTSFYTSVERRYANEGLNFYSLVGALPTSWGTFGVAIQYFGFELYNEQLIGMAYGRQLSDKISIGAQFDYLQLRIPSYGRTASFTAEFGLLAKISRGLMAGFHLYNPFEIELADLGSLPLAINFGLSYQPSEKIWLVAELEKQSILPENIKAGISYHIVDQLALRIGIQTQPSLISFGIGYQMTSGFSIDAGSSAHPNLGLSPLVGLGYQKSSP